MSCVWIKITFFKRRVWINLKKIIVWLQRVVWENVVIFIQTVLSFVLSRKILDIFVMVDSVLDTLKSFWMVSVSFNNSMISPACHGFIRFSKDVKWSFDFDFREGFCKRRPGITIIALNGISFNGDSRIHSFISRDISSMKLFPASPDGNKNRFFFQYTIFS